ncbi:hypothetical protein HYALB_00004466 [Hymenoscyphus albidus]|uniref:Uncharacterized protein n=1 Tax=Hymenoscyphus albidus TaxID=595503 RepID=A0A9N9Q580_9HELO|nr:hypothetical protein HYALB_00004466 [Hymenoscyphus albidus]
MFEWTLQERVAAECLRRLAERVHPGCSLIQEDFIRGELESQRFKNWLRRWGIQNRRYTIDEIHKTVTQKSGRRTFIPQSYIDQCYSDENYEAFMRAWNEAIAAVHDVLYRLTQGLPEEAARKEREEADYYVKHLHALGIWNELNWPAYQILAFKHFIKKFSPTPTKPIWNWIELQYAMEDYAKQQNWQRKSFPFLTLMAQYFSRQNELDRDRRLDPARENPIYR